MNLLCAIYTIHFSDYFIEFLPELKIYILNLFVDTYTNNIINSFIKHKQLDCYYNKPPLILKDSDPTKVSKWWIKKYHTMFCYLNKVGIMYVYKGFKLYLADNPEKDSTYKEILYDLSEFIGSEIPIYEIIYRKGELSKVKILHKGLILYDGKNRKEIKFTQNIIL